MPHADSRSYTVREIAAILAAQEMPEGIEASQELTGKRLRQVRHWTSCDYLHPSGKKHSGTGVSRRYEPDEVRKAALLRELTRFGLTVTQLGADFGDSLEERARQQEWRQAVSGETLIFCQIVLPAGSDAGETGWLMNLVPDEKNLLRLLNPEYRAIEGQKASKDTELSELHFVSCLTVSLTQLFATLRL